MTEVYRVGYLERLPLGTPYPGIVAYIGRLLGRLPGAELVIDFTGVGRRCSTCSGSPASHRLAF